ncbi:DUF3102 domain-containing protein [Clostridium arbusti]|uniref:DUF3102 domain-containing protein n=1 Tax=Clostridium arbusti TaxID=1137848 RepID=UPI0035A25518
MWKVDFHQTTANKFMRLAKEFGNVPTLAGLTTSKLYALLDVPSEDREDFVSQPHKVSGKTKTVDIT